MIPLHALAFLLAIFASFWDDHGRFQRNIVLAIVQPRSGRALTSGVSFPSTQDRHHQPALKRETLMLLS